MNRAHNTTGSLKRLLLVIGASLPLFAIGCVAQVGPDTTDPTESSSAQLTLPKPVQHDKPGDGTTGGGSGSDGTPDTPPTPLTPPQGTPKTPSDGKENGSGPVPSPWDVGYSGESSSSSK